MAKRVDLPTDLSLAGQQIMLAAIFRVGHPGTWGRLLFAWAGLLGPLAATTPAWAQSVVAQAVFNEPMGVARVEIPVAPLAALDPAPRIVVREASGRIYYPAIRRLEVDVARPDPPTLLPADRPRIGGGRLLSRIGQLVRSATAEPGEARTVGYEYLFLFPGGAAPLELRVESPVVAELRVTPVTAPAIETRALLTRWWLAYRSQNQNRLDAGDYPPLVETYLTEMLGQRLGLPTDEPPEQNTPDTNPNRLRTTLELLGGAPRLRNEIMERTARGEWPQNAVANLPVPAPPQWTRTPVPDAGGEVPIEETALRVPPECFYLRFGNFPNYLWFQDLSADYGGDLAQMVMLHGIDTAASKRLQERLNLQSNQLSRVFGPQVIEDMAVIGHDLMFEHGPALGVLFKSSNPFLLRTSINGDREKMVRENSQARLTTVMIASKEVSLLDTPDHRLRSFWVDDGTYQLVTTSRYLAQRFIEVSKSKESLGVTAGFRYARQLLPLDQELTVFAYFSSDFFQQLLSPAYVIELQRRMRADADLSMVHLARAAARGENLSADGIDRLIQAGFLPRGFGHRPDGSGPIVLADDVLDSLRGRRGSFIPVRDVAVDQVTLEEAEHYRDLAQYYTTQWGQIDPLVAGIRRESLGNQRERVAVHAEVAPLVAEKYGWLAQQLGPPTRVAIQFAPDDVVYAQAHVITDFLGGTVPPHHLFAAIKDMVPPEPEAFSGIFKTYFALRQVPGYVGAWPLPGVIDRLPLGLGRGERVGPGMTRLIGGLYRWQAGGFSVLSFVPEVLAASTPFLVAEEDAQPAQLRVHVGDLVGSRLEAWANFQLYARSLSASLAGADFLQSLTEQLKIPAAEAPAAAEKLLGGKITDPLGGTYALAEEAPGLEPRWQSSAWPQYPQVSKPPLNYVAPPMEWFRGLDAMLTQYPDRLVVTANLDLERKAPAGR